MQNLHITCGILLLLTVHAHAEDIAEHTIRDAVQTVLPWLEKGAQGATENNRCFTCHNHALPILALVEAQQYGFTIDQENLKRQLDHTLKHLFRGRTRYEQHQGQEGQVLTAGYALWCLQVAKIRPCETTQAVAEYLLHHQNHQAHWAKHGRRPPADGSELSATYVALKGLQAYSPMPDLPAREKRFDAVRTWLTSVEPQDTEDSVFRLKSLSLLQADVSVIQAATNQLLAQQEQDGGWSQLPKMDSDAYATGTVVATLLDEGGLQHQNPAIEAGIRYLLSTQLADGTWHVQTRAEAFQPYYESGFPHGRDQFISISASSWAAIALLRSLSAPQHNHDATSDAKTLRVP